MIKKYSTTIVALIAVIALIISVSTKNTFTKTDVATTVINNNEIRIGYIIYPPLLVKDPQSGQLSGVSYDIVEEAAKRLNIKTKWTEEVGWGSALEGLKTKRYDILGTQMWPNAARSREAVFSLAPFNNSIFTYVRNNDARIHTDLSNLNSPEFTISLIDGEAATFIVKDFFPKAKTIILPQLASYSEVFLNVVNKKADLIMADESAANGFLKNNPATLVKLSNTPIREYGNSFAFARGEDSMANMWNVVVDEMIQDGTIEKILAKHNVLNDYSINK
jgi:ABC-type amino acid transport substrate-binding protein